jgi:lipid A 4'-phosphatase
MHYLNLKRSRIILASFVLCSLLLTAFPAIDLAISRALFHAGTFVRARSWQEVVHVGLTWFLCLSMTAIVALYSYNRLRKRSVAGINGRKVLFLFLVLIIGAGLIVNVGLKDNFGRARPRDIAEFGGTKVFTPAFVLSRECDKNCSFSSGDAAGGFFALALAMALTRRRSAFLAGLAFGALMSFARISSGAHFFSDAVVSFFVMLIVADVLYHYVVLTDAGREEVKLLDSGLKPA